MPPITLTAHQRSFMNDSGKVQSLAAWVLQNGNHIAVSIRHGACLTQQDQPSKEDTKRMANYLSSDRTSQSDLARLINGFQRS
jgi:RAB protein geranylgeranyltransferase component A